MPPFQGEFLDCEQPFYGKNGGAAAMISDTTDTHTHTLQQGSCDRCRDKGEYFGRATNLHRRRDDNKNKNLRF